MKHIVIEDILGEVEGAAEAGRGGSQDGGNVLQCSGTGGTNFLIIGLGTFGTDREEGGGHTHGFY